MTRTLPILETPSTTPDPAAGFGAMETSKGPLPLKAMDIQASIVGLLSRVEIRQTFVNTHQEPLEAVYVFPLPPRAAVSRFTMKVADRTVEGQIREREQARKDYQQALSEGKRAALAEEDRPDVFTLSVGNLMPGDVAEVSFEITGLLTLEGDEAEWRFPLVVAPRYIPGNPIDVDPAGHGTTPDTDQVPDASRLNPPVLLPGYPNPVRLGLEVELRSSEIPIANLRSSLHAVTEEKEGDTLRIRLAEVERLDRDFILRFQFRSGSLSSTTIFVPDETDFPEDPEGGKGTLLVTLIPPASTATNRQKRDVVFVLDRSGSMGGWKIQAARRALSRMVDTLGREDRFAVIAFDTDLETFGLDAQGLLPATDLNRFRATEFLARIEADGGTEMAPPLKAALQALHKAPDDRSQIIFLVTDGQVGNEDPLLRLFHKGGKNEVSQRCRLQILGIDEAVNEGLLKRLVDQSGGWFLPVESETRLDEVFCVASRKFGYPEITDITATLPGKLEVRNSLVSSGTRDLYPDAPLMLMTRVRTLPKDTIITLQGRHGDGSAFKTEIKAVITAPSAVRQVWARWLIRDLEDEMAKGQATEKLSKRMTALSLSHRVLCRTTAFLAVDEHQVVNVGGHQETLIQPVELPRAWAHVANHCVMAVPRMSSLFRGAKRLCQSIPMASMSDVSEEAALPMCFDEPPGGFMDTLGTNDRLAGLECPEGCLQASLTPNDLQGALEHAWALHHAARELLGNMGLKGFRKLHEEMEKLVLWLDATGLSPEPIPQAFREAFLDLGKVLKRGKNQLKASEDQVVETAIKTLRLAGWLEEKLSKKGKQNSPRRFWDPV